MLSMQAVSQEIAVAKKIDSNVSLEKWPLPFNISYAKLDLIIRGYFRAGADNRLVTADDLSKTTGLNLNTLKANSRFLVSLGVLAQAEGEGFSLTTEGSGYAKALSSGDEGQLASLIRKLVEESPLRDLANFIELRGASSISYEQLFNHVKTMARLPENPKHPRGLAAPYVTGINTLFDLLIKGGMLPAELRGARLEVKPISTMKRSSAPKQSLPMTDGATTLAAPGPPSPSASQIPISVNIVIEAKDPTSIKELIGLLKELRSQS